MRLKNKDIVEQCLKRIELIQEHVRNIDNAKYFLLSDPYFKPTDTGNLRSNLIEKELTEWRNLAMWGLTLDREEQDRIKAAVYDRFLRDGMSVATWMNNGTSPGSWLSCNEDAFREMAKAAFAPKEKRSEVG